LAIIKGDIEVVNALILYGANLNSKIANKLKPLMFAISTGKADFVKLLLDKNANKNIKNNYGQTPLARAKLDKYDEIVKMLE